MTKADLKEIENINVEVGDEYDDPDGLWTIKEISLDKAEVELVGYCDKTDWGKRKWVSIREIKWFMLRG